MKPHIKNDFTDGLPGVFIALDDLMFSEAVTLVSKLTIPETKGRVGYKVNDLLHDPGIVQLIQAVKHAQAPLFVDAKLHDIPNTVFNTARQIVRHLNPQYMTVHASGGTQMIKAAHVGAATEADDLNQPRPTVLAVTVLTSLDQDDVSAIYNSSIQAQVTLMVKEAEDWAGGIVCSAKELLFLVSTCPSLVRVVPGIRPEWYQKENPPKDDQKRVATPSEALRGGATHLVIGRPIVKAKDPLEALLKTLKEMDD